MSTVSGGLPPLRIGLIATLLSTAATYRGAGIHTYCERLLHHLPRQAGRLELLAYVGDAAYQPPAGLRLRSPVLSTRRPPVRILWEQGVLPLQAGRDRLDLVHGLAYAVPLAGNIPAVVTVHDLSFLLFPQAFRPFNRFYLARITALSCRRARRVIAVSQATARDVQRLLGVPGQRIDVVYNGVDDAFYPRAPDQVAAYRRQAGWPERFILTLGTLEPRKNYVVLIDAYARYRRLSADPLPLLIAGGKGWHYDAIFAQVRRLRLEDHVHFLGFVPSAALPWLYNAATLFVYPSRYEGFGLPLAEAMACGTPAVASAASSLPEIAGAAAVTVPPDDVDGLAAALTGILSDTTRMATMRESGLVQASRFRWSHTAAMTAAVYARALEA